MLHFFNLSQQQHRNVHHLRAAGRPLLPLLLLLLLLLHLHLPPLPLILLLLQILRLLQVHQKQNELRLLQQICGAVNSRMVAPDRCLGTLLCAVVVTLAMQAAAAVGATAPDAISLRTAIEAHTNGRLQQAGNISFLALHATRL